MSGRAGKDGPPDTNKDQHTCKGMIQLPVQNSETMQETQHGSVEFIIVWVK